MAPLSTAELQALLVRLPALDRDVDDHERITQLRLLESLKAACAGVQAAVTVAFDASQRADQAARGVPARERGKGVGAQVALARRDSPARASRHLGLAKALAHELPHTMAHLLAGRVSEWRATLVCRETAALSPEDRLEVDRLLAADLPDLGDAGVAARARALACRLDAAALTKRASRAESERRVTLRPAPDTMTLLTALLPVHQGVAAFAALTRAADQGRSQGDARARGQFMADTLVERLTGQSRAKAVPVEVQLVMPAETLLAGGAEPAAVPGHAPVPATFARKLLAECAEAGAPIWLRRLLTSPDGTDLVGLDRSRRRFDGALARALLLRDQLCRTPWCDAPIRHLDHIRPVAHGGQTTLGNGQGLCEACNYAKEAPGWRSRPLRAGPSPGAEGHCAHSVSITTPTGHAYRSTAPPILPGRMRAPDESVLERYLLTGLAA